MGSGAIPSALPSYQPSRGKTYPMMTPSLMLQKTAGFLMMPAGLLWLGLLASSGLAWRRGGRLGGSGRWREAFPLLLLTIGYTVAMWDTP